jgi:FAD:protein FMN transferase
MKSWLLFFLFLPLCVCASESLQREVYLMGTDFRVALFEPDEPKGWEQLETIVRTVEDAESQLSTWRDSSELSRINQQTVGSDFAMSPSLCELMEKLNSYAARTGGAFDPTVGQLLRAWKIQSGFRIATQSEVASALANTGFSHAHLRDCSLRKTAEILFDAGAFGKGEALDRILEAAGKDQYASLVLDFGGQIAVWNLKQPFVVTLSDPDNRAISSPVKIKIQSGSVSTSGGSEHDGRVNSRIIGHIVDPKTGYPVPSFGSVTVWHPRALDADILSTALYVMGPQKGFLWAQENNVAACFLFKDKEKPLMTPAFRDLLTR